MSRSSAWLLAAVFALPSAPAEASTVVLTRVTDAPPKTRWRVAEDHLRDELRALGLTVAEARISAAEPAAIAALLAEHAADAAVQVTRAGKRASVLVWLAAADGAEPFAVSVAVDARERPSVAMLRAAELVRAEIHDHLAAAGDAPPDTAASDTTALDAPPLVPPASPAPLVPAAPPPALPAEPAPSPASTLGDPSLDIADDASFSAPSASPAIAAEFDAPGAPQPLAGPDLPEPEPPRRHGLFVAATVSGGSIGALTGLELEGRRELTRRLELAGGVGSAVTPGWRADVRGSILVGLAVARLGLASQLALGRRVALRLAGSGGLALAWAAGRAVAPYRGSTDVRPIGHLSFALALVLRLAPRAALHTGVGLDLLLPSLVVRSAGTEFAALGPVLARGFLGLSWDWPLPRRSP